MSESELTWTLLETIQMMAPDYKPVQIVAVFSITKGHVYAAQIIHPDGLTITQSALKSTIDLALVDLIGILKRDLKPNKLLNVKDESILKENLNIIESTEFIGETDKVNGDYDKKYISYKEGRSN